MSEFVAVELVGPLSVSITLIVGTLWLWKIVGCIRKWARRGVGGLGRVREIADLAQSTLAPTAVSVVLIGTAVVGQNVGTLVQSFEKLMQMAELDAVTSEESISIALTSLTGIRDLDSDISDVIDVQLPLLSASVARELAVYHDQTSKLLDELQAAISSLEAHAESLEERIEGLSKDLATLDARHDGAVMPHVHHAILPPSSVAD